MHHLPPSPGIAGLRHPKLPEINGFAKSRLAGFLGNQQIGLASPIGLTQKKCRRVAAGKRKLRNHACAFDGERHRRSQSDGGGRADKRRTLGKRMNLVLVAGVIESRKAFQAKAHTSCYGADPSNDLMIVWRCVNQAAPLDGHEIDEFGNPVGAIKPRNQNIGIRQVKLFAALRGYRGDFEVSALFIIQDGCKDAG